MAEKKDSNKNAETQDAPPSPGKPPIWRQLADPRALAAILVVSLVINAVAVTGSFGRGEKGIAEEKLSEIPLGEFHFRASPDERGHIATAEFSLHVALLPKAEQTARQRLTEQKYRVKQDIEELIRQAHSGDFEDPTLSGLKRQLQAQINEALRLRAVEAVVITDLRTTPNEHRAAAAEQTAQPRVPWLEKNTVEVKDPSPIAPVEADRNSDPEAVVRH